MSRCRFCGDCGYHYCHGASRYVYVLDNGEPSEIKPIDPEVELLKIEIKKLQASLNSCRCVTKDEERKSPQEDANE